MEGAVGMLTIHRATSNGSPKLISFTDPTNGPKLSCEVSESKRSNFAPKSNQACFSNLVLAQPLTDTATAMAKGLVIFLPRVA